MRAVVVAALLATAAEAFSPLPLAHRGCKAIAVSRVGVISHRQHRQPLAVSAPVLAASARLRGGGGEELAPAGGTPLTVLLISVWYAASVVCNQSSKELLRTLGPQSLTLMQLVVSSACGAGVLVGLRACCRECSFPPIGIQSRAQLIDTSVLAAAFTCGFVTLNACMEAMHVSLVMVLRAAEPLTTLIIGAACFGTRVPAKKIAALLPIVAGCALSAVGPFAGSASGIALAIVCNVCFSLRGLLGKQLSARFGTGPLESFFQLCAIGALLQATLLLIGGRAELAACKAVLRRKALALVLVNGAAFYAYLQVCIHTACK